MAFGSMGSGDGDDSAPLADINVTPLVDVMLVLLIVFMITMPVLTHSIPLQLPVVSSKSDVQPKDPLRLSIDKDGNYALGETTLNSKEELESKLLEAKQDNPEVILAIAADKEVPYEHVAIALSIAKDAGLSKVGFVTQQEDRKPATPNENKTN
ncbi:ExbD/TolR family protein [Taylorella equigenitalis]|uniref:Biopolymer transport protein ExbD/TolR n=3 Tax=Taylorella equigenitalis TaxID=29575 RepID=A0A654KIV8_TAYEM|nr:biopolymer transporter ExbD [Taylorella equigenitalis]ADU92264.1 Biopolymer transport protein ExbD/TolR [Taylorella equigenitalis MCE9]AFN35818.1 biopolymer transport protein ExbD [Taylorella equigenitalis ATCC 35865]ASY30458.1 biopolymer transporter ExbD [Taylorella equigenitalis]ASY37765.1 biopolymer transporter ExbD [Taylorella equigenitalis]ASY39233.1 biopolymer transporter ExbD [Taylorella equigenitalis]